MEEGQPQDHTFLVHFNYAGDLSLCPVLVYLYKLYLWDIKNNRKVWSTSHNLSYIRITSTNKKEIRELTVQLNTMKLTS
ncbi:hypothetical protein WICANDRAFT_82613 [Wickerhamomyces anomalus NRRL Y-366-8]|uniref:Uncharacterized protein n=1 Tax=Wickerhamomyces anomalus (strain ATCC 58044 / CBS 1984 / NCYC 433 / NRRL Y-366-8) TaxID=683960 RepID=A0A1E3PB30_WICAA|nr:uncharacterized protein WICANDRAFT_82613 [Wickerhamomyces anomalus NRRL Y-366-8]ODQ62626.1 hypothetical protein WICANDRAFT_82613 [Wickerhamomyces anomalus NRRL Y-366-8]